MSLLNELGKPELDDVRQLEKEGMYSVSNLEIERKLLWSGTIFLF